MSAAERLALQQRLLPGISAAEVSRTFAADFDPANVLVTLTLPSSAAAPTEAELVGLGRTALDVRPGPAARAARDGVAGEAAAGGGRGRGAGGGPPRCGPDGSTTASACIIGTSISGGTTR